MFRDMVKIQKNSTYEELPFVKAVSCIFFRARKLLFRDF